MSECVRTSRFVVAALLVLLAWLDSVGSRADIYPMAEQVEAVVEGVRVSHTTSRGGLRSLPAASQGHETLLVRSLFAPPTPTPTPAPPKPKPPQNPEPTPEPGPRLEELGIFRVTGYSDSPLNGTDGRGITKSGEKTRWGVVAVDPSVIPLRSRLVIEGMGETVFSALDTGGGIRGKWVDVWFPTDSDALRHGSKQLPVYLVVD